MYQCSPQTNDRQYQQRWCSQAFKGSNKELLHAYFKHTPFLNLFDAQVPFAFDKQRFEHHHVCAKSGHGKTTLYSVMLERDLERVAVAVRRPSSSWTAKGDFLEKEVLRVQGIRTRRLAPRPPRLRQPHRHRAPVSSSTSSRAPMDLTRPPHAHEKHRQRTAIFDLFTFVFGALDQKLTGRQQTPFRAVSSLML